MSVILKNSANSTIYTFPRGTDIISEPVMKRLDSEHRAYQNGATLTGDEKIEPRIISLRSVFGKATKTLMETELKSIKKACNTEDLRLYATQNSDDFYEVEMLDYDHTFPGLLTAVEINIDFQVVKPFRFYKDATTDTEAGITASPHAYTITTNDGDEAVYPVWTFTGGASTALTKIKIANAEDGAKYFEVTTAIGNADAIEIDCQEGTCEKNGSDIMSSFEGAWVKIASGTNNITITSTGTVGTCSCVAVFRKKYL